MKRVFFFLIDRMTNWYYSIQRNEYDSSKGWMKISHPTIKSEPWISMNEKHTTIDSIVVLFCRLFVERCEQKFIKLIIHSLYQCQNNVSIDDYESKWKYSKGNYFFSSIIFVVFLFWSILNWYFFVILSFSLFSFVS